MRKVKILMSLKVPSGMIFRMCRLEERMDKHLINLLKSFKEPGFLPSKSSLNLATKAA
jgi:hypothetical protein